MYYVLYCIWFFELNKLHKKMFFQEKNKEQLLIDRKNYISQIVKKIIIKKNIRH